VLRTIKRPAYYQEDHAAEVRDIGYFCKMERVCRMKTKLFGKINMSKKGLDVLELEGEINAWLEKNPDINVVDIKQSSNGGSMQNTKLFFSIWYE